MRYCPHQEDSWDETDDGETYCELCDATVCPICSALYERELIGMDSGEIILEPSCDCSD